MNPLDPNTLEQLAGLICDTDGPHHRQYWQLEKFFTNAGWFGVPPYDESGRERWTRELLLSRRDDPASIAQITRRLADPREYPDDPDSAVAIAEQLNRILAFEGLQVSYLNGRPELVERDPAFRTPAASAPLSLRADQAEIVHDNALTELLRKRLDEARTCREYGAHLSSVIMLGSVLEGVLNDVAMQHKPEAYRCRLLLRTGTASPGLSVSGHWFSSSMSRTPAAGSSSMPAGSPMNCGNTATWCIPRGNSPTCITRTRTQSPSAGTWLSPPSTISHA